MSKELATKQDQSPQVVLRGQFDAMDSEIEKVLPEHVSLVKFKRIILTVVNRNPDLMEADRRSLFAACLDAATDGLPPDGRDAALVVFKTKVKGQGGKDIWIKKVQYMPMISGIYKKVRNAGEISTLSSHVVYTSDDFDYWIDEKGPHLKHVPYLVGGRGQVLLVYAVCKLKDGSVEIEAMTTAEIEQVRQVSRAKDSGPWATWWGEMARKTVIRRLSKRLPMSSDLERLMQRDDSMYDLEQDQRLAVDAPPQPKRVDYKPTPPAQGEEFDEQYRQTMAGDETKAPSDAPATPPASASPPANAAPPPADGKDAFGLSPETQSLVVDGHVILLDGGGTEIGRYQTAPHYFDAVRAQLPKAADPRGFLKMNEAGAHHFIGQDVASLPVWEKLWADANEAADARASME